MFAEVSIQIDAAAQIDTHPASRLRLSIGNEAPERASHRVSLGKVELSHSMGFLESSADVDADAERGVLPRSVPLRRTSKDGVGRYLKQNNISLCSLLNVSPQVLRDKYHLPGKLVESIGSIQHQRSSIFGRRSSMQTVLRSAEFKTLPPPSKAFAARHKAGKDLLERHVCAIPSMLAAGELPAAAAPMFVASVVENTAALLADWRNKWMKLEGDGLQDAKLETVPLVILGAVSDVCMGCCASTHFALNFHNGLHSMRVAQSSRELSEPLEPFLSDFYEKLSAASKGDPTNESVADYYRFLKHLSLYLFVAG
eukprot:CAMPEP_0177671158 /NCGR_PEP_ID=MMETSP0447-20121125/24538_1 /TAXON_ID=0 /ORGANISM="Stygamoeba regulata, Strain BSH-02190019" /LENGTH=311 /DNA_ID=CAMNT_0019178499 /DNA_START=74 /DNA_END=1005 /DNA_ORIENTATION=+